MLLGRSPRSPSKPPIAELVNDATPNETMPPVEDDHVVSMEDWDGKSLRVAPLGVPLGLLLPEKVKITASSQAVGSASGSESNVARIAIDALSAYQRHPNLNETSLSPLTELQCLVMPRTWNKTVRYST
jgi:hypothetical protein